MSASSTYMSFLMHKKASAWEKLIDIIDYPDLGGTPEQIQITNLSNKSHTYIPGVQSSASMTFNANYDKDDYTKCYALKGREEEYSVWFGGTEGEDGALTPTGTLGKFDFKGQLDVFVAGGGVNEARKMTLTVTRSSDVTMS